MLDAIRSLFTRRQDTNDVAAPDLGNALMQPGAAHQVQVAIAPEVQEPQRAEVILPAEPAESEEMWSARMRKNVGFPR